jgi:hypothetical protein
VVADVEQWWWPARFSIFGVTVLHLADEQTYRRLRAALKGRRNLLTGRIPVIQF